MRTTNVTDGATLRIDGFDVALLRGPSPERERWERALDAAGLPLPLPHRTAWAATQSASPASWFVTVADSAGAPAGGVAVHVSPSRALPGHLLLRCERFGPGVAPAARRAAVAALVALAHDNRRVLRLNVETFAADDEERSALEQLLRDHDFTQLPADDARIYEYTLLLALDGDEAAIFEGLSRTARRNIKQAAKAPVAVRAIEDPALFARLDDISRETYARTGGAYHPADWAGIVELSRRDPASSRLIGLFHQDIDGPDGLLAFAWACGHGDHAHYSRSGSTRATELKISLMYPVLWDLVTWARGLGMQYFDFGGVSGGTVDSDDPLGGISDFKRHFTQRRARVGAEWTFEPRQAHARAARAVTWVSTLGTRAPAVRLFTAVSALLTSAPFIRVLHTASHIARVVAHRAMRG